MKLSFRDEATILRTIRANPDSCVVLPDDAYSKDGTAYVYRDHLQWTMPRYLWTKLGRELTPGLHLLQTCSTTGCVSPMHRNLTAPVRAPHGGCPNGHAYTAKTTGKWPDGSRRCLLCQEDRNHRKAQSRGGYAKPRTECPKGHKVTKRNTYEWTDSKGRKHRKCRTCSLARQRQYRQNQRTNKETP